MLVPFASPHPCLLSDEVRQNSHSNLEIVVPAVELLDKVFGSQSEPSLLIHKSNTRTDISEKFDGFPSPKGFKETPEKQPNTAKRSSRTCRMQEYEHELIR